VADGRQRQADGHPVGRTAGRAGGGGAAGRAQCRRGCWLADHGGAARCRVLRHRAADRQPEEEPLPASLPLPPYCRASAARTAPARPSASQSRSARRFSFDRRVSTFALSVLSPAAAAICAARSGRPASCATSSRSRWPPAARKPQGPPATAHRQHPDHRWAARPSGHRNTLRHRRWRCFHGSPVQHLVNHLPGDHQPRQLLLDPGQTLRQLRDPPAQLLRFRPGRSLPALQFIDQRPHQRALLAPARNSRSQQAPTTARPSTLQVSQSLQTSHTQSFFPPHSHFSLKPGNSIIRNWAFWVRCTPPSGTVSCRRGTISPTVFPAVSVSRSRRRGTGRRR
jgi:hypothetical protein